MSSWTYSIMENYCTYSWASKKVMRCVDENGETTAIKNKNYISNINRPKWCIRHNHKKIPCLRCFDDEKGKCKFFAHCEADKKEYKTLEKGMKQVWDDECKKWSEKHDKVR